MVRYKALNTRTKSTLTYFRHTVWNRNERQRGATLKNIPIYFRYTVRNRNGHQRGAILVFITH